MPTNVFYILQSVNDVYTTTESVWDEAQLAAPSHTETVMHDGVAYDNVAIYMLDSVPHALADVFCSPPK